MTSQISYRLLTVSDSESYHQLRLECLKNHPDSFGDTYEEELKINNTRFMKELTEENNHSFWYGAFDASRLIGISGFIQQKRIKTKHRGDLVQVYVNPGFTGQGIGRELVKLTISKAFENAAIEHILLSVVHTNDKAIRLYKKLGFVEYGFMENYFKKDGVYTSQLFMVLPKHDLENLYRIRKEQIFPDCLLKLRSLYN